MTTGVLESTSREQRSPRNGSGTACVSFSVIIPVFNEAEAIAQTIDDLQTQLVGCGADYEIIVVDDGSTDATATILASRQDIRLVEHDRNRGYGAALKTGIRQASYPLVVITDADGTYPHEHIIDLLRLAERADMVVGARIGHKVHRDRVRAIPKWLLTRFAEWVVRRTIPDLNSGLRVFRKSVAERFMHLLCDGFSFTSTITVAMLTNGCDVLYAPIEYRKRVGKSKIHPLRDTLRFLQVIFRTGLYFAPLRVLLPVAGLFAFAFLFTLLQDIFLRHDLTERTLILLVASTQLGMFSLLADMIDKRIRN